MKNILIAVFALVAAASVAQAQQVKVDFDGSGTGQSVDKAKFSGAEVALAPASMRVDSSEYDSDYNGELNHFKKGTRCVGGNCEGGYPGENCNIHTCGPDKKSKDLKQTGRMKEDADPKSLGEMLRQLDGSQQQRFFNNLRFKNGALVDFYSKDVKTVYGEKGVSEIIRYFLPESQDKAGSRGCKPGDQNCTEDSYIDNARCSNHTCQEGYPNSTCTEAC